MSREHNRGGAEVRAAILKLAKSDFKTAAQLADALGKSVNTIRAYYCYPMVAEGLLQTLHTSSRKNGQAYKKA
jgi:predicted ArsR family transcriptional regulator